MITEGQMKLLHVLSHFTVNTLVKSKTMIN